MLDGPRPPRALANYAVITGDGLTLGPSWEPSASREITVVLAGRATTVPFTAVMIGPERTTTDNPTASLTCAAPQLRR
jgi:hypothetical protein